MDDLGGKPPIFGNTPIFRTFLLGEQRFSEEHWRVEEGRWGNARWETTDHHDGVTVPSTRTLVVERVRGYKASNYYQ